jgi:tetraacyldisaccharide 4'-kinase
MNLRTYFRLLAQDRVYKSNAAWFWKGCVSFASLFYSLGREVHSRWYRSGFGKRKRFVQPVISVGNITWGGTGKTPLVEYLARYLLEQKKTPLILARGYGADESKELVQKLPKAHFGFGKNRYREGQKALQEKRADIVILDDGFQHWSLHRDLDIVAISAIDPFGNSNLLPRGILREPIGALKRASIILLTDVNLVRRADVDQLRSRIQALAPQVSFVEARHEPLYFYRPRTREKVYLERLSGSRVTCFSGIGTPRSFQMLLNHIGLRTVRSFEFCDHHAYTESELNEIKLMKESSDSEHVITTEKDYFRCEQSIPKIVKPLVLKVQLVISSGEEVFQGQLKDVAGIKNPVRAPQQPPRLENKKTDQVNNDSVVASQHEAPQVRADNG